MSQSASASDSALLAALGRYSTLSLSLPAAGVLQVTLSHGKLNAMNRAFWSEMRALCAHIASAPSIRVVLLTAAGKLFTAGLDLADHASEGSFLTDSSTSDPSRRALKLLPHIQAYQQSFSALENLPQPVVVAIQGPCIGGGVDLISACDVRLASRQAWFSIKEVDVGMAADVGTLQRLPKIVGNQSRVREWCYTGRKIDWFEALQAGLVSHVCDSAEQLAKESLELCVQIASKSPLAVAGTKANLLYSRDHSVEEGLRHVALWNATALQSEDVGLSMQAAMTKQKPIYSNL